MEQTAAESAAACFGAQVFSVLFVFLVRRWRFEAIMIDQEGRPIADKKNVEYIASAEDGLNGANTSGGQPTDTPTRADVIAFAELV